MLYFTSDRKDFPEQISKVLISDPEKVQLKNVKNNFNSICPDSAQSNGRLCFSDGHCSAGYGTGRAVAELKKGGNWFADFKADNKKYIVFRGKILKYQIGNQAEKETICSECQKMGISAEQMAWPE